MMIALIRESPYRNGNLAVKLSLSLQQELGILGLLSAYIAKDGILSTPLDEAKRENRDQVHE